MVHFQNQAFHLTYPSYANVRRMRVTGDFNGWSAPGDSMVRSSDGTAWTYDLALGPGVYRYVLLENSSTVPTGEAFSKQVKVILVEPADYKLFPAVRGDGLITPSGVSHSANSKTVRRLNQLSYLLVLRTRKDDVLSAAVAAWNVGGEQKNYPMKPSAADPLFDYYQARIVVNPSKPFQYRFLLDDGHGIRAFDRSGLSPGVIGGDPFEVQPNAYKILPGV